MNLKTAQPSPSSETPQKGGGCCGGNAHGAPESEPDRHDASSGAQRDTKPGGCGCGNR